MQENHKAVVQSRWDTAVEQGPHGRCGWEVDDSSVWLVHQSDLESETLGGNVRTKCAVPVSLGLLFGELAR